MIVTIHFSDKIYVIKPIVESFQKGENYSAKIDINYNSNSMELTVDVESDEFKQEVAVLINPTSPEKFSGKFNLEEEIKHSLEDSKTYLSELGASRQNYTLD